MGLQFIVSVLLWFSMADEGVTQPKTSGGGIGVVVVVVVLLLAGLAFLAFSNKKQPVTTIVPTEVAQAEPSTAAGGTSQEATEGDSMAAEATEVEVTGKNFAFNPAEIRVKKGQKVIVKFSSEGGFHDFVIDEFNVATKQLQSGQSDTVEFTPDKTGTFEYYCSVGNHRQMGMVGKLIVE